MEFDEAESGEWSFKQCFGERKPLDQINEQDMLTSVEFSPTGDYLATGDRAGRVVIFEVNTSRHPQERRSSFHGAVDAEPVMFDPERTKLRRKLSSQGHYKSTYKFKAEFQSHVAEFDALKSIEIEEKINKIKWCAQPNNSARLLTTNDKTIKLWNLKEFKKHQVAEKSTAALASMAHPTLHSQQNPKVTLGTIPPSYSKGEMRLSLPRLRKAERAVRTTEKRVFQNAHTYAIHSISPVFGGDSFLSADDLRIYLWDLNRTEETFCVMDIKPENMDMLTEVVTSCESHPSNSNLFVHASSRGTFALNDLRLRSRCSKPVQVFSDNDDYYASWLLGGNDPLFETNLSYFSEILGLVSDLKFAQDGTQLVSRDYLTIKLWDVRRAGTPVKEFKFLDHLKPKLRTLYQEDSIFDKFEISVSGDGRYITTGSYENCFYVFDLREETTTCVDAIRHTKRVSKFGEEKPSVAGSAYNEDSFMDEKSGNPAPNLQYKEKTMHLSLHPEEQCLAFAIENNLYIYGS